MSVGRNDPCPCGSGKKYKKCCLNLQLESAQPLLPVKNQEFLKDGLGVEDREVVTAGEVGDYGTPVLTKELFDQLPPKDITPYNMISSLAKRPHVLQKANQMLGKVLFRGKEEARKIKKAGSPEELVKIMLSNPDPINHHLLLDRVLENSASTIPRIVSELTKPQRNNFCELAIQAIYRSKFYPEETLLALVTEPNATAYDLSLICMLLGMLEIEGATKPLWDYYHFFKKKFPNHNYWKGPLTGLADIKYRQDHPIEVTQEQCALVVQNLQQSGINIDLSAAREVVTLVYTQRILKLLTVLLNATGTPGEDEQAQAAVREKLMAAIPSLLQTITGFAANEEDNDED